MKNEKKKDKKKKRKIVKKMVDDNKESRTKKPIKLTARKITDYEKKLKSMSLFRKLKSIRYVKLLVEGEYVKFDLNAEICLTPESVSSRFYTEAGQLYLFRRLLNQARFRLAEAKDNHTSVYAHTEIGLRGISEEAGEFRDGFYFKRLTEIHPAVVETQKEVRKQEHEVDLLEAIMAGLETQRSMVITAAAQDRNHTRYLNNEEED